MNKNVPKLRFKEFSDEWNIKPFFDCVNIRNGLVSPLESPYNKMIHIGPANIEKYTGRLLEYRTAEEDKVESGKYLFDKQSIIYSKIRPELSKVIYPKFDGICSADTYPLNPINEYMMSEFIYYQLLTSSFLKFVTSTSERTKMPKVNRGELSLYKFKFPTLQEQKKIVSFLNTLDSLIEEQDAKVRDLELYKKGMMQKIFKQEIRFKDDNGLDYPAWEEIKLKKILKERKLFSEKDKEYPHVTLSKEGIYEKGERYDRDFLVKTDNKKYKVTLENDICYNPANLKFGVICRNNYGKAIFSPIYITFEVKKANSNFIEYFICRNDFINKVRKYEEGTHF